MNTKTKKRFIALKSVALATAMSIALMGLSGQANAYVPVIDPTAIAKQIEQVVQMQKQVRAATDNGNFAGLIDNASIRSQINKYLPAKYTDVLEAVRAGDTKTLQILMQQAMANEAKARTKESAQARVLAAQINYDVQNKIAMDRLIAHSKGISNLVNQLDRTPNVAQKQDLTASIQAQSAIMQNEIAMAQLGMQKMQQEQERANALAGASVYKAVTNQQNAYFNNMFSTKKK